jgi:hypothetical protein
MGDWGQGKTISDPDQGGAVTKWADLLMGIMEDLARLESGLVAIKLEQARLEERGMYPAVPSESWESRNGGEARYLRMVFPMGSLENGGRKLYVGADPARIRAAQDKATRRLRWERLEVERGRLERMLRSLRLDLERDAQRAGGYVIPQALGLDLGTGAAPPGGDSVTKEPGEWLRVRPQVEYNVRDEG